MGEKFNYSRIDYFLVICVMFLAIFGAAMVYSASSYKADLMGNAEYFFSRQMGRVLIGFVLMLFVSRINYRFWLKLSPFFLLVAFIMLLLLVTHSPWSVTENGATRWLKFGSFKFQPSDFARYALIMTLAYYVNKDREKLDDFFKGFVKYVALVAVFVFLIVLEKDLGTAIILSMIAFVIFYFAEIPGTSLLSAGLSFSASGLVYMIVLANPYQMDRIIKFVNQFINQTKLAWQLDQSLISLAMGGVFGVGIGNSRAKYLWLPEAHKDFIFSIIGEEAGLIGTIGILILFGVIMYRGFKIANNAPDGSGRLLASGIIACIIIYAFVNAAVSLGAIPTTGVPMPFISYGGSSLISHMAAMGLLINISAYGNVSYSKYSDWRTLNARLERAPFKKSQKSRTTTPIPEKRPAFARSKMMIF
ncbi:putative lipid II flippase FtsW [candidate division KSB1 bacterium]|nr:putative lipid II flippase FtsW [candidate division KSB1 bacterium]